MSSSNPPRPPASRGDVAALVTLAALALSIAGPLSAQRQRAAGSAAPACANDNGGLVLPEGFCAQVVASNLGPVRQLVVAPNGDLYAALSRGSVMSGKESDIGGVLAFRDSDGDGRPDERAAFGPGGGNDVKLHDGYLYYALNDRIVRWRMTPGKLQPDAPMETVVAGLPSGGDHSAKSMAFVGDTMLVNFGSGTNACQQVNRKPASKGRPGCPELEERAGVWAFAAARTGQTLTDGERYATGLRNAMAMDVRPGTSQLWVAVNGRDQLGNNWGFSDERNAENPGEELAPLERGDDFGWPFCYYDTELRAKVLAPEYGGDGKTVGDCAGKTRPAFVFPAHYAPLAIAFNSRDGLGPAYKGGAFVAFHGSWNRVPLAPGGYQVGYVTFAGGRPTAWRTFARAEKPDGLRAAGVAVAPDGALYISADQNGKIWRVVRRGS